MANITEDPLWEQMDAVFLWVESMIYIDTL